MISPENINYSVEDFLEYEQKEKNPEKNHGKFSNILNNISIIFIYLVFFVIFIGLIAIPIFAAFRFSDFRWLLFEIITAAVIWICKECMKCKTGI